MLSNWLILANANLGKAFQSHTRRSASGSINFWYLSIAVLVIGFFILLANWSRIKARIVGEPPPEQLLFNDLCKLHNISDQERQLLQNAIENKTVPQPAYVFVDRTVLTKFAEQKSAQQTYATLIEKLFGGNQ